MRFPQQRVDPAELRLVGSWRNHPPLGVACGLARGRESPAVKCPITQRGEPRRDDRFRLREAIRVGKWRNWRWGEVLLPKLEPATGTGAVAVRPHVPGW